MYYFFAPALVALIVILAIWLRDQKGSIDKDSSVWEEVYQKPQKPLFYGEEIYVENFSELEELEAISQGALNYY